jgi:hypothetical protein
MPAKEDRPAETGPTINFAAALGEAGHECADLGVEDTPDTGPLLRDAGQTDIPRDEVSDDPAPLTLGALGRVPMDPSNPEEVESI